MSTPGSIQDRTPLVPRLTQEVPLLPSADPRAEPAASPGCAGTCMFHQALQRAPLPLPFWTFPVCHLPPPRGFSHPPWQSVCDGGTTVSAPAGRGWSRRHQIPQTRITDGSPRLSAGTHGRLRGPPRHHHLPKQSGVCRAACEAPGWGKTMCATARGLAGGSPTPDSDRQPVMVGQFFSALPDFSTMSTDHRCSNKKPEKSRNAG